MKKYYDMLLPICEKMGIEVAELYVTLDITPNAYTYGDMELFIHTNGTDIDKLMPPVSRFGSGGRTKKKQTVVDKLKAFFERFFGIG